MISTSEASKRSNGAFSASYIAKLARRGKINGAVKQSDGTWLIPEEALSYLLSKQRSLSQHFLGRIWLWWEKTSKLPIVLLFVLLFTIINNALDFVINTYSITDLILPGWSLYVSPAKEKEILILVTTFNGSGDYDPSSWIYKSVFDYISNGNYELVRVEKIPDRPINRDEALKIGIKYKATILIWGNFDNAAVSSNFEIVPDNNRLYHPPEIGPIINQGIETYNLYIAKQLPSEMKYLTLLVLGQTYEIRAEYKEAIEIYTQAINHDLSPENINVNQIWGILFRAQSYMLDHQYDNAIIDYEKALSLNPTDWTVCLNLGAIYANQEKYDKAIEFTQKAIEYNPTYSMAYSNLGTYYFRSLNFQEAEKSYLKALELWKSDEETEDKGEILTNYCALFEPKDLEKGREICEQGVEYSPNDPLIYHNYGNLELESGNFDQAISLFNRAIELGTDDPKTYQLRGVAYRNLGKNDLAIGDFEKTIQMDPKYGGGYYERGVLKFFTRDLEAALLDFDSAEACWGDNALTFYYRGKVNYLLGHFNNAISDFSKLVSMEPENSEGFYYLGASYIAIANTEKGLENYTKAYELNNNFVDPLIEKAFLEVPLKMLDAALTDANIVIEKDPYWAEAYLIKAKVYYLREEYHLASDACQQLSRIEIDKRKYIGTPTGCLIVKDERGKIQLFLYDVPSEIDGK